MQALTRKSQLNQLNKLHSTKNKLRSNTILVNRRNNIFPNDKHFLKATTDQLMGEPVGNMESSNDNLTLYKVQQWLRHPRDVLQKG